MPASAAGVRERRPQQNKALVKPRESHLRRCMRLTFQTSALAFHTLHTQTNKRPVLHYNKNDERLNYCVDCRASDAGKGQGGCGPPRARVARPSAACRTCAHAVTLGAAALCADIRLPLHRSCCSLRTSAGYVCGHGSGDSLSCLRSLAHKQIGIQVRRGSGPGGSFQRI